MTLRLTAEQTRALREAAADDAVSMHEAVVRAVEDYLSRRTRLREDLLSTIVQRDRDALERLAEL